MPHRPRAARDTERLRAVAVANASASHSAMDRTLAQMEAAFDQTAAVNDFKLRVERLCRINPYHPTLHARFGARARMLSGCNLATAAIRTERWWREERRAFQIASAFGRGSRLSLDVLRELRLVLRLMRFKRMDPEFAEIAAAVRGDVIAEAAE